MKAKGNNDVLDAIGCNIRALRKASGQSQTRFAEMIGVNRSYVSQIEHGKMNMTVGILAKIADGLDVPLTALFAGLDANPPRNPNGNVGNVGSVAYAIIDLPENES